MTAREKSRKVAPVVFSETFQLSRIPPFLYAMSKRDRDFKRKKQEDQEAAAYVFQDFIDTFQNPTAAIGNKTFVRSGILYADKQVENGGQIYKPKPVIKPNRIDINSTAIECAKILKDNVVIEKIKKKLDKPKSNLDLLKEELKLRHSDGGDRERLKEDSDLPALSYFEGGDPNSTNLFVANLRSTVTEHHLMTEFGAYGPLASVKIMWPRGDEKTTRHSNCGFVAFMSRKDAERALKANKYRDDMRVGWGKSVEIPPHPFYIPDELLKHHLPPPLTGLPFNAQPPHNTPHATNDPAELENLLAHCTIKVTFPPLNKKLLNAVHRMVEFVVREGPMFEAFIMNRELHNPDFSFLFDYRSPLHVYYRWRIFSILNGDCQKNWSMRRFRMFKGGSVWIPPTPISYTEGMPDALLHRAASDKLSESQCGRLIGLIRNLSMHRAKIAEAMLFCLHHKAAIEDAVALILESLSNPQTSPLRILARLYLLSDVLHNCRSKRIELQECRNDASALVEAFTVARNAWQKMNCLADREQFRTRILRVLRHWDAYKLVSDEFCSKVEALFPAVEDEDNSSLDEPLDGANLLKRSSGDRGAEVVITDVEEPVRKKGRARDEVGDMMEYFVPSKWDAVDPEEVEAQAMSTEKMYFMALESKLDVERAKKKRKKKRVERC